MSGEVLKDGALGYLSAIFSHGVVNLRVSQGIYGLPWKWPRREVDALITTMVKQRSIVVKLSATVHDVQKLVHKSC